MALYQMTTKQSGTRLRTDHTTYAAMIASYNSGRVMEGTECWIAPADGAEVKKGDKWLRVLRVDGVDIAPGWMAFTHKGLPICKDWREFDVIPTPEPPYPPPAEQTQYVVTVDEGTRRLVLKRADGLPMTGWTADIG